MIQRTNIDVSAKFSPDTLSLQFQSDGSLVVKKGSTTIRKSGSSATITGGLIKRFKGNVVEDVGLVQRCFTEWMIELRKMYKDLEPCYHDESVLITSIKYTKVIRTLVVASLTDKVVNSSSPLNAGSNDTVSPSVSDPLESKAPKVRDPLSLVTPKMQSRLYSTKASVPYEKQNLDTQPELTVPFHRVPSMVRLVRLENGSFEFEGIEGIDSDNLLCHRDLKTILDSITGKVRELESITDKGYVNSVSLADYPVLSGYLRPYVKTKEEGLDSKSEEVLLKLLDKKLTLNEKRILSVWFYSLFNLNMYYLIIDVLDKCGYLKTEEISEDISEGIKDLIVDLKTYASKLWSNISPSIRESLRQRGITVSKNIYCGFDTEYKNKEMKDNQILSAQWAVNSKLVLSLPYLIDYDLSGMNTVSGEIYPINSMWFDQEKIDFNLLQGEIRGFISKLRLIRYSSNDRSIKAITKGLLNKGIPYFIEKEKGKINFVFPRSPAKTYIKTLGLEKLDLKKLVQIGLNLEYKDLESNEKELYSLLKSYNLSQEYTELLYKSVPDSDYTNLTPPDGSSIELIDQKLEDYEQEVLKPDSRGKEKGRYSRTTKTIITGERLSITTRRNFYIIGHLTQADLSLLSDFTEIKKHLDIVNKCMVTLGSSDIVIYGHSVIFRDTVLLAPGGKKSLAAIGSMYGDHLKKINLSESQYQNMDALLKEDPNLFKDYALRDSLISLVHAQILEDANFKLNKLGIPLTLSSLGSNNLRHFWKKAGYKGYQLNKDYLLGDSRKLPTPKGLFSVGNVGLFINNYISNYKGGRNESFMWGKDPKWNWYDYISNYKGKHRDRYWYDYDLTSAYTSAMSMLGDPNYDLARRLSPAEIEEMSAFELLYSYTTIEVKSFQFPESIRYPSIACYADEVTTVYPLSGKAVLTGVEYLTALKQHCKMEITGGTLIPYRISEGLAKEPLSARDARHIAWDSYKSIAFPPLSVRDKPLSEIFKDMPFQTVIKDLQSKRREHLPRTIQNLLYKEMGNSLYGSVSKGINHKVKFDIKTNKTVRMEANDISNPILASWITAFIRSLLGELLQNVQELGGKVVSVTTDGFITDVPELESLILNKGSESESYVYEKPLKGYDDGGRLIQQEILDGGKLGKPVVVSENPAEALSLLKEYRKTRDFLSGNPTSLELKHQGHDLMSWTTRGQLSVVMGIKAVTGLQTKDQLLPETWNLLNDVLNAQGKTVTFTSTNLRSATEIYKHGGHVTMDYRDQDFRMWYNNQRVMVENVDDVNNVGLLDSRPVQNVEEALTLRRFANLTKGGIYQKSTGVKSLNKYKSYLEIGVRTFIKDVVNNRNGVSLSMFNSYKGIIDFIRKYLYETDQKIKRSLDSSYVSHIKMRSLNKVQKAKMVPPLPSIIKFFDYVKDSYKDYDTSLIFAKS